MDKMKGHQPFGGSCVVDSDAFYFNKSDLVVTVEPRQREPLRVDDEMRLPSYMHTCIEELSRDCCVYYMAPKAPSEVPVVKYTRDEPDCCFPLNEEVVRVTMDQLKAQQPMESVLPPQDIPLLQHYHPDYTNPPSTFKRAPPEPLRKVLQEEPFNYNLLLNLGPIVQPDDGQKVPAFKSRVKFEPIFGTATVYAVVPSRRSFDAEELVRVSEAFHFDATEKAFQEKYPEVYHGGRPETGLAVPVATADAASDLSACMFSIPMEFQKTDLFLIVQLSKVLTGDGDKAVAPYLRSSGIPEAVKHEDSCRRLYDFRQPLAISIWKLFDDAGNVAATPRSSRPDLLTLPFYCLRSCINDPGLKQFIREFYPKDGYAKPRLDVIDIEMNFSFYDLGNSDEILDKLPNQLKQNYDQDQRSTPDSRSNHNRMPSFVSDSSRETPIEGLSNPTIPLYIVPSQFHEPLVGSEDPRLNQLAEKKKSRGSNLPRAICFPEVFPVRKLMHLDAVREFEDDYEALHSSFNHTLFLYPLSFDKFHHRNLCLRVMLVELSEGANPGDSTALHNLPHTVLKHVYNSMPGSMFTDFAHTQVSYHNKSPVLNDEIKIRLPLAVTSKHYLLFEMHHVHVKPKNETRRSSISSMLGFKDQGDDTLSVKIGQAFHPLLILDKASRTHYLPPNGEYSVIIFESEESEDIRESTSSRKRGSATFEPGVVRFSIVSKSSFVSSSPQVQQFFMSQERVFNCYGGVLPSSLVPYNESKHHMPKIKKKGNPSGAGLTDLKFVTTLTALLSAPRRELKLHFLLIMRQLINTLCSGGMVFNPNFFIEDYASPVHHPAARCWSFIAMLHLFHKIEPEGSNYAHDDAPGRKSSIISAYVEFLLDEEVPWNEAEAAGSSVEHDSTEDTKNMMNVINELRLKSRDQIFHETPNKKTEEKYLSTVSEHCTVQVENIELNGLFEEALDAICAELSAIVREGMEVTAAAICAPCTPAQSHPVCPTAAPSEDEEKDPLKYSEDSTSPRLSLAAVLDGKSYTTLGCDPWRQPAFRFEEEPVDDADLAERWYPEGVLCALRPRGLHEPDYFVDNVNYSHESSLRKRTPSFLLRSDSVTGYLISNDRDEQSTNIALDILAESGSETSEVMAQHQADRFDAVPDDDRRQSFRSFGESVEVDSVSEDLRDTPMHTLQPILPMPKILEGSDERRLRRKEMTKKISLDIKSMGMPVHHSSYPQQWWPYLYEVITQQWFCLLTALTQKTTTAATDPIMEEGSEDEDSNDDRSDTGGYDHQGQYAFSRENMPSLGTVPPGSSPDEMIRWIALDQGPVLLRMMMKSIAIRVARSRLRPPVMFDDAYLHLLEKLVVLITKETMALNKGINRHSKLNAALASFLKELFGVVALVQVAQLIQAYFRTVRGDLGSSASNVNVPDLRLKFLGTIASFDDFVGINIPLVLESISELDSHELVRSRTRSVYSLLDSGRALRWMQHPRAYWLSHLVIEEVIYIYRYEINNAFAEAHGRQDVQGFRKRSLRFICDLLVRICYDPRFQSPTSRRRIAIMFCPMLREITSVVDRLASLEHDAIERKEFLIIFLYLLQNYPENLLRSEWRHFLSIKDLSKKLDSIRRNSDAPKPDFQSLNSNASASSSFSSSKNSVYALPILQIFELMHLCLDTFEYPMKKGNAEGNPSKILAPVLANDVDNAPGGNNTAKRGTEGTVDKISRLENIRQSRAKGRPADLRRKSSSQAGMGAEQENARSWKKHMTKVKALVTITGTGTGRAFGQVPPSTLMRAAKFVAQDVAKILFNSLEQVLQEFEMPPSFSGAKEWAEHQSLVDALRLAASVCLHGLMSSQSVAAYSKIFDISKFIVSKFGARLAVLVMGSTMQEWMTLTFKCCNSIHVDLRVSACSFFLHLLISVSREYGSINVVYGPMFTMFGDVVLSEINRGNKMAHLVSNHEKKSGAYNAASSTGALKLSLTYISDVLNSMCIKSDSSAMLKANGLMRIKGVVLSLLKMLQAYCLLNNYFPDFSNSRKDAVGSSRGDLEYTVDLCFETSEVFDPILLPTFRIRWLVYIARLHILQSSIAEHAECLMRMHTVYQQCMAHWQTQWFPRPLIQWSHTDPDAPFTENSHKNFLETLQQTLSQKPVLPWESESAFREGMISMLQLSMDHYFKSRFFFLAEKVSLQLLAIHRAHGEFDAMRQVYERQAEILSNSLSFSTGNYFRVMYVGPELPLYLADKEFIYRNADLLHVSEFQSMLKNHLRDILPGLTTSVIPDSYYLPDSVVQGASEEALSPGSTAAYIIMAAVKPLQYGMDVEVGGSWSDEEKRRSRNGRDGFDFDALSRVSHFQYSVPFTKVEKKAYAKTIDKQWKKTTYLTVKNPFPFVNIRAEVVRREVRELSPIENGISDVEDCIQQMRERLAAPVLSRESVDVTDLKRFIQGTVVAQVNGGAAAVATVFLGSDEDLEGFENRPTEGEKMRLKLREILLDFLTCSRLMLERTEKIILETRISHRSTPSLDDMSTLPGANPAISSQKTNSGSRGSIPSTGPGGIDLSATRAPDSDAMSSLWMSEMQREFNGLVDIVVPLLAGYGTDKRPRKFPSIL